MEWWRKGCSVYLYLQKVYRKFMLSLALYLVNTAFIILSITFTYHKVHITFTYHEDYIAFMVSKVLCVSDSFVVRQFGI